MKRLMAIGAIMSLHSISEEEYSAMLAQLVLNERVPTGALVDVAGSTVVGWRGIEVWDSQEAFNTFSYEKLEIALQKAGIEDSEKDH